MMSFSKREKTLLMLLAVVVFVVGVGGGILQPVMEEWVRLQRAVDHEMEVQQEIEEVLRKAKLRDCDMKQKKEELEAAADRYNPWMDGHDMGRMAVTWLDESGLHAERMSIDTPKAFRGKDSMLYVGVIHGTAEGTREAVCDCLDRMAKQKAVKLAGFSLASTEEGDIRMEYEVEVYMLREMEEVWRE